MSEYIPQMNLVISEVSFGHQEVKMTVLTFLAIKFSLQIFLCRSNFRTQPCLSFVLLFIIAAKQLKIITPVPHFERSEAKVR